MPWRAPDVRPLLLRRRAGRPHLKRDPLGGRDTSSRVLGSRMGHMRTYLRISGLLFGVITLLHILRLMLHWSVQIADWAVPTWVSWIAMLGAAALCTWAFRLVGQTRLSP